MCVDACKRMSAGACGRLLYGGAMTLKYAYTAKKNGGQDLGFHEMGDKNLL